MTKRCRRQDFTVGFKEKVGLKRFAQIIETLVVQYKSKFHILIYYLIRTRRNGTYNRNVP